ncbi:hypothetical protein [Mesotoga sp. HF07.pep.5.2.highcov]|uniref:hypothetical protein n=1 Tax=Mesotoga sp. HF07.pep.5.2.highcov TaxID=1462923 RepID=UPI0011C39D86|nr:hypothetical protein [Mesotoga sp. HF07.pep.5.2.highcov]
MGSPVQGHPELVSGSGFDLLCGVRKTVDGQRGFHQCAAILRIIEILKQVQMTESQTRTWTRGVGTKNRFFSEDGGLLTDDDHPFSSG